MAEPYVRIYVSMPRHPKIEALDPATRWLLVELICYCHENRNNGIVPAAAWKVRGTAQRRKALLEGGCAHLREDGRVELHDYLDWQQSDDEIEALSSKRSASGKQGAKAKAAKRAASAQASATAIAEQTASKPQAAVSIKHQDLLPEGGGVPPETLGQRANRLTKAYTDRVPLSKFPAIAQVVTKALKVDRYTEDQIRDALVRMAEDNRSVTVDALRTELDGWKPFRPRAVEQSHLPESLRFGA